MEDLKIMISPHPVHALVTVVYFEGDFDGSIKENLTKIQEAVHGAPANAVFILELSKLNYLNSYAIGHLMAWHTTLGKQGGHICIVGANESVKDIFEIVGISQLLKGYDTVDAAIEGV